MTIFVAANVNFIQCFLCSFGCIYQYNEKYICLSFPLSSKCILSTLCFQLSKMPTKSKMTCSIRPSLQSQRKWRRRILTFYIRLLSLCYKSILNLKSCNSANQSTHNSHFLSAQKPSHEVQGTLCTPQKINLLWGTDEDTTKPFVKLSNTEVSIWEESKKSWSRSPLQAYIDKRDLGQGGEQEPGGHSDWAS